MKVLVTGAAGFIGSHLVRGLLEAGHHVRAIDNLATGYLWRIESLLPDLDWRCGSIVDAEFTHEAARGVDVVLHQAALPSVSRSLDDPVASNEANAGGTITLLQACREAGVRRLVFAGSSSVYGDSPTLPKVETMCPAPRSPYAVSKLAAEKYCQVFAQLGLVETICFRYFNVFGPMQDPNSPYSGVIAAFCRLLLEGRPVVLNGDGTQSRDFTFVENVVRANLLALTAPPEASGEVINIACGQRYDLNFMIAELARLLGVDPVVERRPARAGDVSHSLADIAKAGRLLGYEPVAHFPDGLRRTVTWYAEALKGQTTGPPTGESSQL